jgi:hypothetical protein
MNQKVNQVISANIESMDGMIEGKCQVPYITGLEKRPVEHIRVAGALETAQVHEIIEFFYCGVKDNVADVIQLKRDVKRVGIRQESKQQDCRYMD